MILSWRSVLLGIGALQGFVVAALLLLRRRNRVANRLLAALLAAVSWSQMPQILGFAGVYGVYPELSMAPFEMSWMFGALIWLYPFRLIHGRLPRRWGWALLPVAVQLAFYTVCFLMPLPERWAFVGSIFDPYLLPVEIVGALLMVAIGLGLSVRRYFRYQRWLAAHVSDRENYRLTWLRNFLVGLTVALAVVLVFEGINAFVTPLGYRQMYPMHGVLALLIYYFGFEGYRNAEISLPIMPPFVEARGPEAEAERLPDSTTEESPKDWPAVAAPWVERVERERMYLDPNLTLTSLARALATNPSTLSKGINRGVGLSFNDFVNAYRVAEVQRLLDDPAEGRSLLDLALACGFNSKTSFNRSFRQHAAMTPSAWRERVKS